MASPTPQHRMKIDTFTGFRAPEPAARAEYLAEFQAALPFSKFRESGQSFEALSEKSEFFEIAPLEGEGYDAYITRILGMFCQKLVACEGVDNVTVARSSDAAEGFFDVVYVQTKSTFSPEAWLMMGQAEADFMQVMKATDLIGPPSFGYVIRLHWNSEV